jgi:predicted RNA-binding protein with PUA-like domain
MAFWLVKSDPDEYGFADLERDRRTTWDGVANQLALQHLRRVRRGDQVLIYHTGPEKAIVGLGLAVSDGYADPVEAAGKLVVFDLQAVRRLARPVTLAELKADAEFSEFELVRMPRLSVMPVPAALFQRILAMSA